MAAVVVYLLQLPLLPLESEIALEFLRRPGKWEKVQLIQLTILVVTTSSPRGGRMERVDKAQVRFVEPGPSRC